MMRIYSLAVTKVLLPAAVAVLAFSTLDAQTIVPAPQNNTVTLYRTVLNPELDAAEVYQIRGVSIDREDLHVSMSDGMMGLIKAVDGRITGAIFEGSGELLLIAPDRAERTSLALFTGSAVLEQQFGSAYFRFVDDKLVAELRAGFRKAEPTDVEEFVKRWQQPVHDLARADGLHILQALTNSDEAGFPYIHVRLGGTALGIFDVFYDAGSLEQISVAKATPAPQGIYFDTWASFPARSSRREGPGSGARLRPDFSDYVIRASINPPTDLSAEAEFTLTPRLTGQRMIILELSRHLRVSEVLVNGQPVDFIQNEAVTGSDLARRGDDLVGIAFPQALEKDRPVRMSLKYSGPVMFDTGGDLLYVGARGTWYPNAGPVYSDFDLSFTYPEEWTLVATGQQISSDVTQGRRTTRFVTAKAIARAGFNLGKFITAEATSGKVTIHAHASKNVERDLAAKEARAGRRPEPSREVQAIADLAASTVGFLSNELDPFPYTTLEITQLPGMLSQSWPGLVYLSSMVFLDHDERRAAGIRDPYVDLLLSKLMLAHETGHQWWGDAVDWVSYRDEWIIEALANYSALIMLERQDPQAMRVTLDYYRGELLKQTPNGLVADAGPVTLGPRLTSSKFPDSYERVMYGRGTWLIHMLRIMLREAGGKNNDALFFAALKGLLDKSPNHKISTRDLQTAFEQVLPPSLNYEKKKSLEWFFDGWVNGASIPQFTLSNVNLASQTSGKVRAKGVIKEAHASKDLITAVPIFAVDGQGKRHFLAFVFADDPETDFTLTAPAGTKQIVLDPENSILRR